MVYRLGFFLLEEAGGVDQYVCLVRPNYTILFYEKLSFSFRVGTDCFNNFRIELHMLIELVLGYRAFDIGMNVWSWRIEL